MTIVLCGKCGLEHRVDSCVDSRLLEASRLESEIIAQREGISLLKSEMVDSAKHGARMTARALAAERSRDEARAEVERLKETMARHDKDGDFWHGEWATATRERDEARVALRDLLENSGTMGMESDTIMRLMVMKAHWERAQRVLSGEKEGAQDRWTFKEVEDLTRASWGRGYAKGAEWMREQAAKVCAKYVEDTTVLESLPAKSSAICRAVEEIRSLPTSLPVSPPAPEEDK